MESTFLPVPYFSVYARVAFIPSSQSPMARADPAAYSVSNSEASISFSNPSRIASSVSDEIQSRFTGTPHFAFVSTHRCISSPSWPASPQLMTSSACFTSSSMTANCFLMPSSSISRMRNFDGIIGSTPMFHFCHFSVYSPGSCNVHRCPKVHVTQYPFPSRYPFLRVLAPKIRAISFATLGFSAMHIFIVRQSFFFRRKDREHTTRAQIYHLKSGTWRIGGEDYSKYVYP